MNTFLSQAKSYFLFLVFITCAGAGAWAEETTWDIDVGYKCCLSLTFDEDAPEALSNKDKKEVAAYLPVLKEHDKSEIDFVAFRTAAIEDVPILGFFFNKYSVSFLTAKIKVEKEDRYFDTEATPTNTSDDTYVSSFNYQKATMNYSRTITWTYGELEFGFGTVAAKLEPNIDSAKTYPIPPRSFDSEIDKSDQQLLLDWIRRINFGMVSGTLSFNAKGYRFGVKMILQEPFLNKEYYDTSTRGLVINISKLL